jgi:hypothetical protein
MNSGDGLQCLFRVISAVAVTGRQNPFLKRAGKRQSGAFRIRFAQNKSGLRRKGEGRMLRRSRLSLIRVHGRRPREQSISKDILQRELHDSRIEGTSNLSESPISQLRIGINGTEAVGDVVRFCSNFETASLA